MSPDKELANAPALSLLTYLDEPPVQPVLGHQLRMGALLDDAAILYHQDLVGVLDGGQPVGDDQCRAASGQTVKGALDAGFRHAVQRGGGLIQYQNGRGLQKHPGDGYPLLLPAGEQRAPLAHIGVEPVGHGADIVVDLRLPRRLLQLPYDLLNRLNRRKLLRQNTDLTTSIRMDDYRIGPVGADCFDLFYIATK